MRRDWAGRCCFIGEDQSDKLVMLTEDLRREFSDSGDGKAISIRDSRTGVSDRRWHGTALVPIAVTWS